jgi:hypothetical protein
MKCYVLIISEKFPKTHKRAGELTNFPLSIKHYDKIHTIRANYYLWEKRFKQINEGKAYLSVRVWEGKPYKSKQQEIFRFDKTRGIGIEKLERNIDLLGWFINDKVNDVLSETLAKNDGLSDDDFREWFKKIDFSKPMAIIHFTDFRYSIINKKSNL